ncbi:ricin-type beta-trefoil lectin domain protein [Streptomyces cyaneochromogenes]|uniref:ricin-type beta-trefoil lectin domain protein n=1 Tax=Streptomyces cyaneochromogenes TaxID=2496836 RepID=UPI001E3E6BBC|nr:ricin-type beta-trefoil lectin domain protein [Streptomyces cyaneochromogenes]
MHDAGPSNSPRDARLFEVTDAQLSAELKRWTGATPALHPVGELLDRHWEAGFAYARLCTVDARSAGMLTTAAFTRLFGETLRHTGPTAAWRPQLLVTVRRIAAEWDTDRRRELLHPELRSESDGAERAAARMLPSAERRLLTGAFQRLPQSARCLLWHTEVEAEPLAVPAGLLGLDEESARVELDRARERLREESLQVHRELAPDQECRRYLRMLDVTYRRGGVDIDPDLREHLSRCAHCSDTAEELNFFNAGLGIALAEAVLGWGAGAYLESRTRQADTPAEGRPPARAAQIAGESFFADEVASAPAAEAASGAAPVPAPAAETFAPGGEAFAPGGEAFGPGGEAFGPGGGVFASGGEPFAPMGGTAAPAGEPFTAADVASPPVEPGPRSARRTARRAARTAPAVPSRPGDRTPAAPTDETRTCSGRSALKAARRAARRRNLTAAVVTVSALVVLPLVVWSALGSGDDPAPSAGDRPVETPGPDAGSTTGNPSWAGAAEAAKGDLRGRLHNIGSGLCVGIVGGKAVENAETELAKCSAEPGQQWSYETDGLMRSAADPDLCLDSNLGYSVRLAPCKGASDSENKNVRYDFTLQGSLVPRFDQDLALSPAATDGSGALVLKTRDDDGDAQHWVIDTSRTELQLEVVNWDTEVESDTPSTPTPTPTPKSSRTPTPTPTPSATPSADQPTSTSPSPTDVCSSYPYYCSWDGQYGGSGGGYGSGGSGGYGGGYGYGGYGGYGYGGSGRP